MGLGFLRRLFGGGDERTPRRFGEAPRREPPPPAPVPAPAKREPTRTLKKHRPRPAAKFETVSFKPYALARYDPLHAAYLDRRAGERPERLRRYGLPRLSTPEDIAQWLKIPLKTLAWLADYHNRNAYEKIAKKQHYHYAWLKKQSGQGFRLIEAPKPMLKFAQTRILRELLDRVPAHDAAHGFVKGRSIRTHAAVHAGKYVLLKLDLQDFYPSIKFKRVVAVFRGLGYGVEAAHWLARLCTSRLPQALLSHRNAASAGAWKLAHPHVPQGAPSSPALANLAAWALDVRLSGLAKKFGLAYTRYADDLTFSGDEKFMRGKTATVFFRYARGIVRDEKFLWNGSKKKVVRQGGRQIVTGLSVNEKPNVPRETFDRLKAILHNCAKHGAASQNRSGHPDFKAHLQGKIAFVRGINPQKAERLARIFGKIETW